MKRLIDVAAVNEMKANGQSIVYTDGNTLLTPAAMDAINANGMTVKEGACPAAKETPSASCCQDHKTAAAKAPEGEVSADLIFKVLSSLSKSGLLNDMLVACGADSKPYEAEYDPAGFK